PPARTNRSRPHRAPRGRPLVAVRRAHRATAAGDGRGITSDRRLRIRTLDHFASIEAHDAPAPILNSLAATVGRWFGGARVWSRPAGECSGMAPRAAS